MLPRIVCKKRLRSPVFPHISRTPFKAGANSSGLFSWARQRKYPCSQFINNCPVMVQLPPGYKMVARTFFGGSSVSLLEPLLFSARTQQGITPRM